MMLHGQMQNQSFIFLLFLKHFKNVAKFNELDNRYQQQIFKSTNALSGRLANQSGNSFLIANEVPGMNLTLLSFLNLKHKECFQC